MPHTAVAINPHPIVGLLNFYHRASGATNIYQPANKALSVRYLSNQEANRWRGLLQDPLWVVASGIDVAFERFSNGVGIRISLHQEEQISATLSLSSGSSKEFWVPQSEIIDPYVFDDVENKLELLDELLADILSCRLHEKLCPI